jgi:hypothetical protein
VIISCGGEKGQPAGRQCFTPVPYQLRGQIGVEYTFQQDRISLANSSPLDDRDVMYEPKAVLAFDMAIRAWIDGLRVKQ